MHTEHIQHKSKSLHSAFEKRVVFFFVTMGVVTLTYGFLYLIDFLPEKPSTEHEEIVSEQIGTELTDSVSAAPLPIRIKFDALDREVVVLNPEDRSVAALDTALLSGVVRHPDSADFKNTGTIFLFGHSSYLPNVHNKNFQAFNGIQKLEWGDIIHLYSVDTEYVYQVNRVYEVSAENANVALERGIAKLTLVTCDSFGAKTDRFVVEATLVGKNPLTSVE